MRLFKTEGIFVNAEAIEMVEPITARECSVVLRSGSIKRIPISAEALIKHLGTKGSGILDLGNEAHRLGAKLKLTRSGAVAEPEDEKRVGAPAARSMSTSAWGF